MNLYFILDIGNYIHLWLVNDSRDKVEGMVVCSL